MRFMILRKADAKTEAGILPSTELLDAMGKYISEMAQAGVLLAGEGLRATSLGVRVKFSGGRPVVTDGPFTESKEVICGYCLIKVASKEEAIQWAKRWPALDGDGNVELELRQVFEAEDFGAQATPELREREALLRSQAKRA
jgi:hypothetical protein